MRPRRTALWALLLTVLWPGVSAAQFNENCVVSVFNRSVRVQPDGSWVLPSVPANIGRVHVRATCVEDGVTSFGQSELVTIPANGVVNIPPIRLGTNEPIPAKLALTAPVGTLGTVGASTQLLARATYPDGTSAEVSAAAAGTNYTVSNARIATVSEDGLVTAVSSGTVLITALNEGAGAFLRIAVVLAGDSDGDGISDDVELANGLNPNDPADAIEDFDHDALTNRQELELGTDIRNGDTDGDTLPDGREVALGTNPLLFDTDGDGLGDGLEVATNSDPLDPASYNLAVALEFIEVTPTRAFLVVNDLVGEASRQLRVTGHLIDGRVLDLTSVSRRTNYASSDLTIVNFGGADGEVFAGRDGDATVTVTNSGFRATVSVHVSSFAPQPLSALAIPGYANNVEVSGDFAYVAAGSAGLQVVDVSNRLHPRIVGALDTPGVAIDVRVVGTLAFVADGPAGLAVIDVSSPAAPVLLGSVDTTGEAQDLAVRGSRVFVADGAAGLQIVDVSTPSAPVVVGSVDTPGTARGVDVSGALAVVADGPARVAVIDVSNPALPGILGSVILSGDVKDVVVRDQLAYVSAFTGGLQVVDFSVPASPRLVSALPAFWPRDFELAGRFGLAAERLFANAVAVVDTTAPASPAFSAIVDFLGFGVHMGTGIAADARYVYMTGDSLVLDRDFAADGDTRLFIGQYLQIADEAGVPPTVSIVAPAAGSQHQAGTTVTVRAEATDDVGVAAVTFSVDGVVVATDATVPFEFGFTLPIATGPVTFGATAVDFGGSQAQAAPVTVEVTGNPAPSVVIDSPAEGASLVEGETVTITATATDDTAVTRLTLVANGTGLPPGTFDQPVANLSRRYEIPVGSPQLTVTASATDNLGQTGTASRTLTVVADPRTTVTGQVVDETLHPVAGATVSAFRQATVQTAADGTFTLTDVSTAKGDIVVWATATIDGRTLAGSSAPVPPVRGGTTAVGTIQVSGFTFHPQGEPIDGDVLFAGAPQILPFPFTFYGVTYSQVFVSLDGTLSFVPGERFFPSVEAFNLRPRIAALFNDWISPFDETGGVFVNENLPGRFVVTWKRLTKEDNTNPLGTFQAVLMADGTIQLLYDGVTARDGIVGITPGSAPLQTVDFSRTVSVTVDGATGLYEEFFRRNGPPFDLDHARLTFAPGGGGYEERLDARAPSLTFAVPPAGASLVEGETVLLTARVLDPGRIQQVAFSVDGRALFPDGSDPFTRSFRVPLGATRLTFSATATDLLGQSATATRTVDVLTESPTTVSGTVVDLLDRPVPGTDVYVGLNGLKAEFFDFTAPLGGLPDLGASPTLTRLVSSLDFRNPGQAYNADTFGVGLSPYFAARFSGLIRFGAAGAHQFHLSADGGARLTIGGVVVVEVERTGALAEASGSIDLPAGTHPIEVVYFQNEGNSELQLSYVPPGQERQTVPAAALIQDPPMFRATTDAAGAFSFAGVPAAMGRIRATATAVLGGVTVSGTADARPVRGGQTAVGTIRVVRFEPAGTLVDPAAFRFLQQHTSALFALPFPFTFFGVTYDSVFVNTNGTLTFGPDAGSNNPGLGLQHPVIAALFHNWVARQDATGGVFVNSQLPDRFVVTWQGVEAGFGSGLFGTFQVVLTSTGRVQVAYGEVQSPDGFVAIGAGPAATEAPQDFDFSEHLSFEVDPRTILEEDFFLPGYPPFDLQRTYMLLTPTAAGYGGRLQFPPLRDPQP